MRDTVVGWEYGDNPISFTEIAHWRELTGEEPEPWHISTLLAMDRAYRQVSRQKSAARTERPALSAELFDAMF